MPYIGRSILKNEQIIFTNTAKNFCKMLIFKLLYTNNVFIQKKQYKPFKFF
jgi:hypothetical protein